MLSYFYLIHVSRTFYLKSNCRWQGILLTIRAKTLLRVAAWRGWFLWQNLILERILSVLGVSVRSLHCWPDYRILELKASAREALEHYILYCMSYDCSKYYARRMTDGWKCEWGDQATIHRRNCVQHNHPHVLKWIMIWWVLNERVHFACRQLIHTHI